MQTHELSRRSLLLAFLPALRAAQQNTAAVTILATVRDKQGRIVPNLGQDDFILQEDGRPQTIRSFSRQTDLPLTLGVVVDTSLTQQRVLGEERTASYRFLDQVLREGSDQAFLIHFDREVELLQDLTMSRKELDAALKQLETSSQSRPQWGGRNGQGSPGGPRGSGGAGRRGGTCLYDAVLLASDELMKKQSGRKALIVLSSGVDTGSKVPITQAIESAQRADTLVYSVLSAREETSQPGGFGRYGGGGMGRRGGGRMPRRYPQELPDGKKTLQRISKETGGGFFEVSKKQPLDQIYERIRDDLRNQYAIGYSSDQTNSAPEVRRISLTTKKKGLAVQAKEGYFATQPR